LNARPYYKQLFSRANFSKHAFSWAKAQDYIQLEESLRLGKWRGYIPALVIIFALAVTVFAQVDQGRIAGTVKDQTGAIIPGARITVKNERTGEERSIVSGDKGDYLVVALKPSTYRRKVAAGILNCG